MNQKDCLEKLLKEYESYYDVVRDDVEPPFAAEALFHSQGDMYFLIKSAKLSSEVSNEFVFFALEDHLTLERLMELDTIAWERGLSRVIPGPDHHSSDVILYILADTIDPDAAAAIRKIKHYKSYRFRLQGWSCYRLVALELSTGKPTFNRLGESLKKLVSNI